jgi:hypothetical protein
MTARLPYSSRSGGTSHHPPISSTLRPSTRLAALRVALLPKRNQEHRNLDPKLRQGPLSRSLLQAKVSHRLRLTPIQASYKLQLVKVRESRNLLKRSIQTQRVMCPRMRTFSGGYLSKGQGCDKTLYLFMRLYNSSSVCGWINIFVC